MIEGPITAALKRARRERWQQLKQAPANYGHWFYKHIEPEDGQKRAPHTIEGHKAALEAGATSRGCMERYNMLTNHIFDALAHQQYGWPHMGDARALMELEQSCL